MGRGTRMTIEAGVLEMPDRPGIVNHPDESAHLYREEDPPRGPEVQGLSLREDYFCTARKGECPILTQRKVLAFCKSIVACMLDCPSSLPRWQFSHFVTM